MQTSIAVLISLAVALVALAVINVLARRVHLLRQLSAPLYLAALAGALKVYTLLPGAKSETLLTLLAWMVVFVPIVLVVRLLALYFFDFHLKHRRNVSLPGMISGVVIWVAYLVTAYFTLHFFFPDLDARALAATSAVTSLVLGLALQPILGNFFAGLVIAAERPFKINDWIQVGDNNGRVTAITWRATHVRTRNNDNLIIPNSKLAEETLLNFYLPHPLHLERILVGVDYKVPPYRVKRVLVDAVRGVEGLLENPTPEVFLIRFDDSSVAYELRLWIEDIANQPRMRSEAHARIWEAFKKHGIGIPFPTRTVEFAPRPLPRSADAVPAAHLFVTDGANRGVELALGANSATVVGRSRSCQLILSDSQASKEHFKIEWTDGGYRLTDLGSSFGTKVNGETVSQRLLADLDRIGVGDSVIVFELNV